MKRTALAIAALFALSPIPHPASAHEDHVHEAVSTEKLGTVHFRVSVESKTQQEFDRAVALLHSFEYEQAEHGFRSIADKYPNCAMAFWGIVMCNYHPIWGPTTQADFDRGRVAIETAAKPGGKNDREQSYVAAIGTYYKDADRLDASVRKVAYEKAMEQLHARFPDELEGTIFYALSILGNAPTTDKTYATQKRAAALLNSVLPKAPDHPGVAHYLIHSLDYPGLADLALPAARAYAKIAPSAPHAQHMPSHIFTRLGLWDESIQSNLAAQKAARALMAKTHPGSTYFEELHEMDYMTYAYLQLGRDGDAGRMVDATRAVSKLNQETPQAAYAFAAVPARYSLERHMWKDAALLRVHAVRGEPGAAVRRQDRLAKGNRGSEDGELLGLDEVGILDLRDLLSGHFGTGRLHRRGVAGWHPDRGPIPRRSRRPSDCPRFRASDWLLSQAACDRAKLRGQGNWCAA